ncbi:MAG: cobalamin biosynthesis protein CobN [Promethearchaeota archaeon]|nr:MAG: cobalamin biosynthesis protein CobN [Candidatus Lokiarchaeota archaeon]
MVKIAFVGKGGVGKTTLAGTTARFLARDGYNVIAIDADPAMNLHSSIGISDENLAKIRPISEEKDLIEERAGRGGIFVVNPKVDDIPAKYQVEGPDAVRLIVMGTVKKAKTGCMCPEHSFLRALLNHLILAVKDAIVIDMEAGIEHLGRGTLRYIDAMAIIIEPGRRSTELAERIRQLAEELQVPKTFVIGNKVSTPDEEEFVKKIAQVIGSELIGIIPYDNALRAADLNGVAPIDFDPNSPAIKEIEKIEKYLLLFIESEMTN